MLIGSIIYVGQGEEDEPARKKRNANAYKNDPDPNKDTNKAEDHQVKLLKRLVMDGVYGHLVVQFGQRGEM